MTDDEAAYIEAKGWKASVVPEPSIIHHFANFCGSNAGALRSAISLGALVPSDGIIRNHRHDGPLFVLSVAA